MKRRGELLTTTVWRRRYYGGSPGGHEDAVCKVVIATWFFFFQFGDGVFQDGGWGIRSDIIVGPVALSRYRLRAPPRIHEVGSSSRKLTGLFGACPTSGEVSLRTLFAAALLWSYQGYIEPRGGRSFLVLIMGPLLRSFLSLVIFSVSPYPRSLVTVLRTSSLAGLSYVSHRDASGSFPIV